MQTTTSGLAQALRERHVLADQELDTYLQREQIEQIPLDQLLLRDGRVSEKQLAELRAAELGLPFIDLELVQPGAEAVALVPADVMRAHRALPLHVSEDGLFVAVAHADFTEAAQAVAHASNLPVHVALTSASDLEVFLGRVLADAPRTESVPAAAPPVPPVAEAVPVAGGAGESGLIEMPTILESDAGEDVHEVTFELHINDLLEKVLEVGASDLHLTEGAPPEVRVHGDLMPVPGYDVLDAQTLRRLIYAILTQKQRERFEEDWELDLSHPLPGKARFRVNLFVQKGSFGAVLRTIPDQIVPIEQLGLPKIVREFADIPRGLVLVTGPTGSGKSTTLASVVDIVNSTKPVHIMTVEDPIEFLHHHKRAIVNQREIGEDTKSFSNALRHVLRQDPDVILVGEMRDLETIQTALTAAETGHLVFATLHTQDAPQSIDRVIDVFPPHQQQQVRVQLATSLQAIMTQQLIRTSDARGRCVATEVMVATPAIRNLIREGKIYQIYSAMQAGGQHGMQTMDQSLADLVKQRRITYDLALERCANQTDLARLCGRM
ncbi:MAG: PilT/PilU family type 4a pilus ATPase [Acidimicrobiia bacterium]|nr:PilT/PilU family type 4a pilus ATPase [Acidimicrobiia bacterium]